ncbi:MAG: glycogen/starch synthase, partial [Eubacterium sp.]|nr:glycogen/starch synthase [Eubacterium sp.]
MKKDTKKATAAKSEAVKEKDTTVKTAASKEPAKIASKKKEPAKIASNKKEPAKISSKKKEPAKIASKKKEPAKIASKKKEPAKIASKKKEPRRKLLLVTPEAQPFLNSGGLGEVAGSLPVALADKGHLDVRVVLPKYRDIPEEYKKEMKFVKWFNVPVGWRSQYCGIFTYERKGVTFYFIDNEYYFDRDGLYGYYDDGERFAFFSRAVMEMMGQLDYYPEIVHANDWQTALVPLYNTRIY